MNDSITKKYLINGPNNVVRLINGTKILYIFGDYHLLINEQTECFFDKKYDSMDIDKFILEFIKNNKNKKYDIFLEVNYTNFYDNPSLIRHNYIWNLDKLFLLYKNKYENIKYHWMDIRDDINLLMIMYNYCNNYIFGNYTIGRYFILKYEELKVILNLFKNSFDKNEVIHKLLNKYNNLNLKVKINDIFELIYKCINNIIKKINKLIDYIKLYFLDQKINIYYVYYNDKIKDVPKDKKKLLIKSNNINNKITQLGVVITDLYFIKRFLDKEYINNSILYTGMLHLGDICFLLVKYFGFKITHINHTNKSIDINKYINKLSFNNMIYLIKLINLFEKKDIYNNIYQCTDLFNFPENFT